VKITPKACSIVGIGESELGVVPNRTALSLQAEAAIHAIQDAGISKESIDGLVVANSFMEPRVRHANNFAQYLGLSADSLNYITTTTLGSTSSAGLGIHEACMIVMSGVCDRVLVVNGDALRSSSGSDAGITVLGENRDGEFENPYGTFLPATLGFVGARYMHDYDITEEDLAIVSVAARERANHQPKAQLRDKRITIADVLDSPVVAGPIRRLNCAIVSDGACAAVVTRTELAGDSPKPPVGVAAGKTIYGMPGGQVIDDIGQLPDLYTTRRGVRYTSTWARERAQVEVSDIDVIMTYDAFSFLPLMTLEGIGYCGEGEAGELVRDGFFDHGPGRYWNTHGGLMAYCHPGNAGGMFMTIESVRQLRGEAVYNQCENAEVALIQGYGANHGNFVSTILTA
jgi:acetyl-CoA acetyltransferase